MASYMFLLLTMSSLLMPGVTSFNLVMSPEHQHVFKSNQTVSFTCTADIALTGCQFIYWDYNSGAGPVLDLKMGSESQPDPGHLTPGLSYYGYNGRGLWTGRCGISLDVKGFKTWIVACRVRPADGGWRYAWAELYADDWTPMTHNMTTPREAVVLPGGEAKFMIDGLEPLLQCSYNLPDMPQGIVFKEQVETNNSTGRLRYLGAGLESGECGVTLTNVSEADNGLIKVYIRAPNWKEHVRFIALIIARPPTAPTLLINYTATHLTATCEVKESRPAANITWYLGNDIIRQDEVNDTHAGPQDEWRWPWMTGDITQTVTREQNIKYQGKMLRCLVDHVTLDQPLEAGQLISFNETECGRRNSNTSDTLIYGRKEAKVGEFPWHVGIYEVQPDTGETIQICGGTIITPQVVVTAAHCFWKSSREIKKDASLYKVAASKHLRSWDDPDPSVQKRNVYVVVVHELYGGLELNFANDIGVLRLESPFDINRKTRPICVDWGNTLERDQLRSGSVGVMAGWGFNANRVRRDTLTYLDLPYVPRSTCSNSLPPVQQRLLNRGNFCAGYVNKGTSVGAGDSGGGLVFLHPGTNKYYLRGVSSIGFKPDYYTAFTRLSNYITWMKTSMCRFRYAQFCDV